MSLKDLSIYLKTDSKSDIAKITKTAFTNQQIFNKNLSVIATYTVSDDANTLISSTYKFVVQK